VTLRIIVVSSGEQAQHVLEELTQGKDFATVAKTDSIDSTAPDGGYMGTIAISALRPELRDGLAGLLPGQISAIIGTPLGFAILKVEPEQDSKSNNAAERGETAATASIGSVKYTLTLGGLNEAELGLNNFDKPIGWNRDPRKICEIRKQSLSLEKESLNSFSDIRSVEVELWLKNLDLAPGSRCKIRNLMSLLFNHGRRHELCERNPIEWVRQSAKRRTSPDVLTTTEVQSLLANLRFRERTLVLLAVTTGLRRSELFALKWKDVDSEAKQIHVTRSIVQNVVGICKTESSQKPVPAHDDLMEALHEWRGQTKYNSPDDWLFASPVHRGRWPYLAQQIMRHHILPVARKLGINKRIGWHTFRHTYSTLLRSTGAELKTMQELLRHSTIRVTLDTYTQAVTTEKRTAQEAVVALLCPRKITER